MKTGQDLPRGRIDVYLHLLYNSGELTKSQTTCWKGVK